MLKVLLKVRISSVFASLLRDSKKGKQRGAGFKILLGILMVYLAVCMLSMFGFMFGTLCKPLGDAGLSWLYFSLAGLTAMLLCFVGSVFTAQSQIFDAKDNELLLSMPIPPRYILASRLLLLLLLNILFELVVLLPAVVVYGFFYKLTAVMLINFILLLAALPFMALTLSCFFGWLIGLISSKLPFQNIITLVLSVVFLGVYLVVFTQLQRYLNLLMENGAQVGEAIRKALFPAYHFGRAAAEGNFLSLFFFFLCALLPFLLVYWILSKNFIKIATAKKKRLHMRYKEKAMRVKSVKTAFIAKELRHFFSSAMYMLNAGMGVILMLLAVGGIFLKRADLLQLSQEVPMLSGMMGALLAVILGFITTMNFVSAPSVSLEGKNLWIAQSAPVDAGTILLAKADAHILVCLPPTLLAGVICCFIVPGLTVLQAVNLFLLPAVITVFTGLFGVVVNLYLPKFDWISETAAVKQGMSTMVAMFGSMAVLLVPTMLYLFAFMHLMSLDWYLLACSLLFTAAAFGLRGFLLTKGKRMFEHL